MSRRNRAAAPQHQAKKPVFEMIAEGTRQTATHIFFWNGPLSNWYVGRSYSGSRALALMLPRLDEIGVEHPPENAFSTRLLAAYTFVCGEQWLMALKGWLFGRDIELFEQTKMTDKQFKELKAQMLADKGPTWANTEKYALYNSTLCKILRVSKPGEHKTLGKKVRNFDEQVWNAASVPITVACSIARAEADGALRQIYLKSGQRVFVEGSPNDTIWGVGVRWNDPQILDPNNWRGENRLGRCHLIACQTVRDNQGAENATAGARQT